MDRSRQLENCRNVLARINVPMGLYDQITIPILAVMNTLHDVIKDMKQQECKVEEGNKGADDSVQRAKAEPKQH